MRTHVGVRKVERKRCPPPISSALRAHRGCHPVFVRVLQHEHVHAQAAQVPAQALQHVVAHHPQLLRRDGGQLGGLPAAGGAPPSATSSSSVAGAGGLDPCGSLTFLNGRRQWTPYLTRFPTGRVFSPAPAEPRGQSLQGGRGGGGGGGARGVLPSPSAAPPLAARRVWG